MTLWAGVAKSVFHILEEVFSPTDLLLHFPINRDDCLQLNTSKKDWTDNPVTKETAPNIYTSVIFIFYLL